MMPYNPGHIIINEDVRGELGKITSHSFLSIKQNIVIKILLGVWENTRAKQKDINLNKKLEKEKKTRKEKVRREDGEM